MDIVSHGLIGGLVAAPIAKTPTEAAWIVGFSFLPDLIQVPLYLLLGRKHKRRFWIPYNTDWSGVRKKHPAWTKLWEIPHSLFFITLVVLPLVYLFDIPKTSLVGYLAHIATDIPTHKKEWAVKIFFPFSLVVPGITDAWAWKYKYWIVAWVVISATLLALLYFLGII